MLAISVSASVMIVAVLFIRLFRKHIPIQLFLFLWSIIAIRLLIPIELPSRLNYIYLFSGIKALLHSNLGYNLDIKPKVHITPQPFDAQSLDKTIMVNNTLRTDSIIQLIWFIGFSLCSIYFILLYLHQKKALMKKSKPITLYKKIMPQTHSRLRKVDVRTSLICTSPTSFGIVKPTIIIPRQLLHNRETLKFVLLHETIHIQHIDSLKKLLLLSLGCLYWFNPFVWVMIILANRDIEIYCDSSVLKQVGQTNKKRYALALLEVAESKSLFSKSLFVNFNSSAIEERIKNIMQNKEISKIAVVLSLVFITSVTTAFATTSYKLPETDKSLVVQDTKTLSEDIEVQTTENVLEDVNKISFFAPLKNSVSGEIEGDLTPELACEMNYLTPIGTPVYAPVEGVIVKIQEKTEWPFGKYIVIQCTDNLFVSVNHLENTLSTLKVGDSVDNLTQIGTSGITGATSQPMVSISVFSGNNLEDKALLYLNQWPADFMSQIE